MTGEITLRNIDTSSNMVIIIILLIINCNIIFHMTHAYTRITIIIIIFFKNSQFSDFESDSSEFNDVTLFNIELITLTWLILISVISDHKPCHLDMIFIRIIGIYMLIMKQPIHIMFVHNTN